MIPYAKNRLITKMGLFISSYNNVDQVWHATLIEELVRRFPPNEPGLFGIALINYHFWFHLVTAELIRVFHLPLFQTQFIGMYALGPILLALIAYPLAAAIYNSKLFIRLVFFFFFFQEMLRVGLCSYCTRILHFAWKDYLKMLQLLWMRRGEDSPLLLPWPVYIFFLSIRTNCLGD